VLKFKKNSGAKGLKWYAVRTAVKGNGDFKNAKDYQNESTDVNNVLLRRADPSSRGVLMCVCVCVIEYDHVQQ
jgi:hypothetical protein